MIDGISGGGGPIRGPAGPQNAARTAAPQITSSDPARALRRAAPTSDIAPARSGRSALVADMAKAPPVNAARVAELRAQMVAGRYSVDPLAIADAMLRLDRGRP